MKTYRVGIIGLGRMGSTIDDEGHSPLPYSIASSCRVSDRLELAAGCDLIPEKRSAFAARWGVKAVYEDYRDMVRQEAPDLVAVCTPASGLLKPAGGAPDHHFRGDSHAELTVALAEAGVSMLYVEKAMASSMAMADAARDAVKKHGAAFNTGVLRRFDNRYDIVRDAVLAGDTGDPKAAVHYARSSLMHGHIHSIDTLSWLLGDPRIIAVKGEFEQRDYRIEHNHIPFDPVATYQLRFENGVEAWSVPAGYWEFEVVGTTGTARSLNNGDGMSSLRKKGADPDHPNRWADTPIGPVVPESTVVACLEDLVRGHESGQPTRGHIDVTHHTTEACIAVAESHRRGGVWVDLPLDDRDLYIWHV